jgi:AAA domain
VRAGGSRVPTSLLHSRLRTWKFKIPRDTRNITPLYDCELQTFLSTALSLVTSGEPDVVQQTIECLASNGGLARIKETITSLAADLSDQECLEKGGHILLPLVYVLTHPDVTQSFILEKFLGIIHSSIYGVGGRHAIAFFSAATRFLSLFEASAAETSKAVVAILTCFHNVVELNSTARVVEEIHAVLEDLAVLLEDDLAQNAEARRLFQRIDDRLKEGSTIPNANHSRNRSAILPHFAALNLARDQPGQLSPNGARHDNDHDDVNLILVLPTSSEVRSERAEYLPLKEPRSLHLGGVEGLVDRQFRLLREDTIGQLRDIVRAEIELLRDPSASTRLSGQTQHNFRRFAYRDIKLVQITFDRAAGLRARLSIPQPSALVKKSEQARRQWWEQSKRLCPDALLCLVDTTLAVTFFTVCGTETGGGRLDSHCSKLLYQDSQRASVVVKLVAPYELDIERLSTSLASPASGGGVLCEFPGVLLPSFYPTLKALQKMSTTLDLPFAEIIAPSDSHGHVQKIAPPSYATKSGFKFDLKSIVGNEHLELAVDHGFDYATLAAKSFLDEAQQTAVINALTRNLALIQGPPGTGKSYTGVALIKILLDNAAKASLGPIVCVCYTNHALDQLLEHLVKDGVEGIIRVGSRSKSELIKHLNLRDALHSAERTSTERRRYARNKSAVESEGEAMKPLLDDLTRPINPPALKDYLRRMSPMHYRQIYGSREDEDGFQVVDNDKREALIKWLHPKEASWTRIEADFPTPNRSLYQLEHVDVWGMTPGERSALHDHWIEMLKNEIVGELSSMLSTVEDHMHELDQCRKEDELRALTNARVVGLTTSGLARNLDILQRINSKVLVCEEAGEVLEAHLLTALLPSVEHAILIGDHQQLKPQIANYELSSENSRGVQYSLDASLFERLVYPNSPQAVTIPYSTLRTQRRMHPSISRLIRSTLYPGLIDHPSVHDYPEVEGMKNQLFWFDHDHPESNAERRDSTSHTNDFEVEMVAALVHHLVRQSKYSRDSIAVITPYLGQLVRLRNKLASSFEIVIGDRDEVDLEKEGLTPGTEDKAPSMAKKTSLSKAVRIATVDNFQVSDRNSTIVSILLKILIRARKRMS